MNTLMIDYSSIIDIIRSDEFVDNTDCFGMIIGHRHQTFDHCLGTGSSLFMKTMACFLDKTIDTKDLFRGLKIGNNENIIEMANTYYVLYLDFSDFNSDNYSEALGYLRHKMSELYKYFHNELIDKESCFSWNLHQEVLDVIEGIASDNTFQNSFRQLMLLLRRYRSNQNEKKLAVLLDNMVRLETVAERKGYSKEMDEFLKRFIVEDVYKYCDLFFQISDTVEDNDFQWFLGYRYRVLRQFSVLSYDVRERLPEMIVAEKDQFPFLIRALELEPVDLGKWIAVGRKKVVEAKEKEERKRKEYIRQEKARYSIGLTQAVPRFSPNMGIRVKRLDKHSPRYKGLNALLSKLYVEAYPRLGTENLYHIMQRIDYKKPIVKNVDELKVVLEQLPQQCPGWETAFVNATGGDWVQATFWRKGDEQRETPNRPENIKVYAYVKNMNAQSAFTGSIRYLLKNAKQMFAAKMAVYERVDQLCYWLDLDDFPSLECYFEQLLGDLEVSMPFIAYKGKLGISKDFPGTDDSHNYALAHIISDYFSTVNDVGNVDLEDMFNNYIAKWNADIYEEGSWGFKSSSALSFVVIMDTIDAILNGDGINERSSLLIPEKKMWRILAQSKCCADVNEGFFPLEATPK